MMVVTIRLPGDLHRDVTSRINGIEGMIAIVKAGAKTLGVSEKIRIFLAESLGDGAFGLFKKYRDAVIHARIVNKTAGIGEFVESRGRHSQVLLTTQALDRFYDHVDALRSELTCLLALLIEDALPMPIADSVDPERSQREAKIREYLAQARAHRNRRLSLPPIPEFSSESELHELETRAEQDQQAALTGWLPPRNSDAQLD
jgi:hypothetical protein